MKNLMKLALVSLGVSFCQLALANDATNSAGLLISTIQYEGSGKHLYFTTENGKWSAGSCNPTYVWIKPDVEGQKEILSIALSAKMANKKVMFRGVCNSNTEYFDATYITVF